MHPHRADEQEACEQASAHGSRCVERVQEGQLASQLRHARGEDPRDRGKRGSHQERGGDHHQRGEEHPEEEQRGRARRKASRDRTVERDEHAQRQRAQRCRGADPELEDAVEPERVPLGVRAAPQQPCPQGEPAEIRRQHRGDGVSRHPEDLLEQPRPDHLVDEPGGPRDEEQPVDRTQSSRSAHPPDCTATVPRARSKKRRGAGPSRARPRRSELCCFLPRTCARRGRRCNGPRSHRRDPRR